MKSIELRAHLEDRKRELDEEAKAVKAQIEEVDAQILDEMAETGVESVRGHGYTFYVRRDLRASHAGDKSAMIEALRSEIPELVTETVNANSLTAWARELVGQAGDLDDPDDALPEPLRGLIKIAEIYKVGVRSA